ncbi:hypothetical protein KUCAC02_025673, partial [Chaenocephalus aceratus]
ILNSCLKVIEKLANDQYALYFVMESAFDFSELGMEHLRRWWCMLLIDNFPVTFEGRRSTKRRLEREDCEDSPRKKDPLAKTAAEEILVSSEEEDGDPFLSFWHQQQQRKRI